MKNIRMNKEMLTIKIIKQGKEIKLTIDTTIFTYKPSSIETAEIKTRLNDISSIKNITIQELFECISKGNTFCPAVLKNGTRNKNWVQQELVAIDIDNENAEEEILTIDKALTLLKENNIPFKCINKALYRLKKEMLPYSNTDYEEYLSSLKRLEARILAGLISLDKLNAYYNEVIIPMQYDDIVVNDFKKVIAKYTKIKGI